MPPVKKRILVAKDGSFAFIHDDDLVALVNDSDDTTLKIRRASVVEHNTDGGWEADLSPVGGPKLGPFDRRDTALAAEHEWLESHNLLCLPCRGEDGAPHPSPSP